MPFGPLAIAGCAFFAAMLISAAVTDILARRIPNRLVIALALIGPAFQLSAGFGPDALLLSAITALTVLTAGLFVFRQGWLGAGDVKLAAAVALWLDPASTGAFLARTAIFGALFAIAHLAFRRKFPLFGGQGRPPGEPGDGSFPYAPAIAAGALVTFAATRLDWP